MTPDKQPQAARIRQLAQAMAHRRADMVSDLVALCAIPSVAADPLPGAPYGRETARALDWFLKRAGALGFRTVNLDNRAGTVEFGSGDPLIAALCHLDVVPAGDGWTSDPFQPQVTADRIIGRGTADDKGPAVAVLYAMKELMDSGFKPKGRIRLIVGLDEERGSSCMAHYVQVAEVPQAGFTPDASFPVVYAEKGLCWLELVYTGGQAATDPLRLVGAQGGSSANMIPGSCTLTFARPGQSDLTVTHTGAIGHASTPWAGQNAISLAMQAAFERLSAAGLDHPFVSFYQQAIGTSWRGEGLGLISEDETGPLTLNAGKLLLDPNGARLTLDIRYPVTRSFDWLWAALAKAADRWGLALKALDHLPPLHVPRDSFLVQTLMDVYTQATGHVTQPLAMGGGTYARSMPNLVAFGSSFPGEPDTFHQAGESISIDHWLASSVIYHRALMALSR